MKVQIKKVTFRHFNHKTLVETRHTPTWFERKILRAREKTEMFIGHKTVWYTFPGMQPITDGADLKELAAIELKFRYLQQKANSK